VKHLHHLQQLAKAFAAVDGAVERIIWLLEKADDPKVMLLDASSDPEGPTRPPNT
jgi:hypothetical protein